MFNESLSSTIQKKLRSKTLLLAGLVLLIIFLANFIKSWQSNRQVNQEISNLAQEVNRFEKDNFRLAELIKYLNSPAYIEEKARTDLGLKKEGEQTVVIPEAGLTPSIETNNQQLSAETKALGNPQRWWRYFFAKK